MRALVIVTVVMGIMIVVGTGSLVAVVVQRLHGATVPTRPLLLEEPAGTHIAGMSPAGDRLAVWLEGGGPDRILLIDPHNAAVVGRVAVGQ